MYTLFNKYISGPFTIPSGIVTTSSSAIKRFFDVPGIGIVTTKSIGLSYRPGNKEPIITEYKPYSYVNAVGLANIGATDFAKELSSIDIPADKFLLISIFGQNEEEFYQIAKILSPFADGFELNLSCPHAKDYGQSVGKDLDLVARIIEKLLVFNKPLVMKLSPNLDIQKTVLRAIEAGISGFTAINTMGPISVLHDGYPVLSNKFGGISGKEILNRGIECVKQIRELSSLPIIACGGISDAESARKYLEAGNHQDIFLGVGSALAGMSTKEISTYFQELHYDLTNNTDTAKYLLKTQLNMNYKKFIIKKVELLADDLFILEFNKSLLTYPGQFIFAWVPEKGEKPFSVLDDAPLKLLIQKRGCFTNFLSELISGDSLYIRGPYGNSPEMCGKILLAGGGTGIAGLYLYAKYNPDTIAVLGAKDLQHLPYIKFFKKHCKQVFLCTENGEIGNKCLVPDCIPELPLTFDYAVNCGPQKMLERVIAKEGKLLPMDKIYSHIDFRTECGIGLCGKCAIQNTKGYRSCVDGPLTPDQF